MRFYYPGDDYIDWIGVSAYSEPYFNTGPPQTFEHKLLGGNGYEGSYTEITQLSAKPLMINEMGLYHMPSEEAKAQWIEDASRVMQSGEFPRISGLVWWGDKSGDYEGYPSSPTFLAGYRQAFDQPFFDAKAQFSGDCRPLAPAGATLRKRTLTWSRVANAASYEVWRAPQDDGDDGDIVARGQVGPVPRPRGERRRLRPLYDRALTPLPKSYCEDT